MTLRQSFHHFIKASRWIYLRHQHEGSARSFSMSVPHLKATLSRSALFSLEKKRQHVDVGRIGKIEVEVKSDYGNELLIMNENISTPHDCAKHISEHLCKSAVLAMVDSASGQNIPWDMHKPLISPCQLKFLKTTDKDPMVANNTFWRSCSFMLGAVVSNSFRDDISVMLHSFPPPSLYSGSFVLDAYIGLESWKPTPEELRALSADMVRCASQALPFERLSVSKEVAMEMFADNMFKLNHIENIFECHKEVVVYRINDHVDISRGPLMNHTGLLGRCTIASVHYLEEDKLFRFQGVGLPQGHKLNHFAYGILENRAKYLNDCMIKFEPSPVFATRATEIS